MKDDMDDEERVEPDDERAARPITPEETQEQQRVERHVQGRERAVAGFFPQTRKPGEDLPLPEPHRVHLVDQEQREPEDEEGVAHAPGP